MLVVIGFFLLGLVCLAALVLTIIAGIKPNEGKGLSLSVLPAADQVGRTGNRKAGACAGFSCIDRAPDAQLPVVVDDQRHMLEKRGWRGNWRCAQAA